MKIVGKILAIIAFSISLAGCAEQAQTPVCQPLSVKGKFLTNADGDTVVLRGVSYGWSNWWSQYYNVESAQWLSSDWHCTVVRAAMGVEPFGGYMTNADESVKLIESVIEGAIKSGIYVIVDWHSHGIHTDEAKQFFGSMAKKYTDCPNIIWEIFNEPVFQSWDAVRDYSIQVIDTIRTHSPNVILVGSPHWDQDIHLVAQKPITDRENIMYTMHFYAATHNDTLRNRCDSALMSGIPLFISESACCEANGSGVIDLDEWNTWINWCETNKISWVTWSISSKEETCSMLLPSASETGNWLPADLRESGTLTRDKIRELNN
jgi:endoglucanase